LAGFYNSKYFHEMVAFEKINNFALPNYVKGLKLQESGKSHVLYVVTNAGESARGSSLTVDQLIQAIENSIDQD